VYILPVKPNQDLPKHINDTVKGKTKQQTTNTLNTCLINQFSMITTLQLGLPKVTGEDPSGVVTA